MRDTVSRKGRDVPPAVATTLNGAAGIACACGVLLLQTPYRLPLVILAIIPPLAAVAWYRTKATYDTFLQVSLALALPGFALSFRAVFDFHFVNLISPCVLALVCAGTIAPRL
jgi:hypothetical protein